MWRQFDDVVSICQFWRWQDVLHDEGLVEVYEVNGLVVEEIGQGPLETHVGHAQKRAQLFHFHSYGGRNGIYVKAPQSMIIFLE